MVRALRGCSLAFTTITPSLLRLLHPCFPRVRLPTLECLIIATRTSSTRLLSTFEGYIPGTSFVGLCKPARKAVCYATCQVPIASYGRRGNVATVKEPFRNVSTLVVSGSNHPLPAKRANRL